jgi:hypothetical protein
MAANLAKRQTPLGHLALVPGMHRMPGNPAAIVEPDHRLADFRLHLARLSGILMAAAGTAAERTLREAVAANKGEYLLAIDGSIPVKDGGVYSLTGGRSNVEHADGDRC